MEHWKWTLPCIIAFIVGCNHDTKKGNGGGGGKAGGAVIESIWPDSHCPANQTQIKARYLLGQVIGWAHDDRQMAAKPFADEAQLSFTRANACKSHSGSSSFHCAKAYAAWWCASKAHEAGLPDYVRERLWLICATELNHGNDGSGNPVPKKRKTKRRPVRKMAGGAAGVATAWPNAQCPPGSGTMAVQLLDAIIGWADNDRDDGKQYSDDAQSAFVRGGNCKGKHKVDSPIHCAKAYSAWWCASKAQETTLPDSIRERLWLICATELNHGNDGSGAALATPVKGSR